MEPMSQFERFSEENIDLFPDSQGQTNECIFNNDLFDFPNVLFDQFNLAGHCDEENLLAAMNFLEPTEAVIESDVDVSTEIQQLFSSLDPDSNLFRSPARQDEDQKQDPVFLSESVAVGVSPALLKEAHTIALKWNLEETFRPRYKSDYFAMNGKKRKPRYVADCQGNHFITLTIPKGLTGRIRVDWLTIEVVKGERYHMPYRFQVSNDSDEQPDRNPIYYDIPENHNGMMKLYLVLIKATQSELKHAQPLKPFSPWRDIFGMDEIEVKSVPTLAPKELIQRYQLNQSQLAFTYCSFSEDRTESFPEWDTTVLSTIMTESPVETSKTKTMVKCPKCCFDFEINDQEEKNLTQDETNSMKRKMRETSAPLKIKRNRQSVIS